MAGMEVWVASVEVYMQNLERGDASQLANERTNSRVSGTKYLLRNIRLVTATTTAELPPSDDDDGFDSENDRKGNENNTNSHDQDTRSPPLCFKSDH